MLLESGTSVAVCSMEELFMENTTKHSKTLQNTPKQYKTLQNTRKHSKTLQNTPKQYKTLQNTPKHYKISLSVFRTSTSVEGLY